jgi:hypothetical protein
MRSGAIDMASRHEIPTLMLHERSPRDVEARNQLTTTLPGADISEPDDIGAFLVSLEADDLEQALQKV